MDRGILLKITEDQILKTMSAMCDESLPPDLHNNWEEIMDYLIATRTQLDCLAPTVGDIAAMIKKYETPNAQVTGGPPAEGGKSDGDGERDGS